jgi:hypothetical protein
MTDDPHAELDSLAFGFMMADQRAELERLPAELKKLSEKDLVRRTRLAWAKWKLERDACQSVVDGSDDRADDDHDALQLREVLPKELYWRRTCQMIGRECRARRIETPDDPAA